PLQASLDQDAAAFAQRGSDRFGLRPEGDHLDTADVGVPGVPLADTSRHGDPIPRHRHTVRRISHLGIPRQIAEEVHAMYLGHTVLSSGPPPGRGLCPGLQEYCHGLYSAHPCMLQSIIHDDYSLQKETAVRQNEAVTSRTYESEAAITRHCLYLSCRR